MQQFWLVKLVGLLSRQVYKIRVVVGLLRLLAQASTHLSK